MEIPIHDRALAGAGLTSYRCKGRYGYIMIGARDHQDAMSEALRSSDAAKLKDLEVWDGCKYVPAFGPAQPVRSMRSMRTDTEVEAEEMYQREIGNIPPFFS